MKRLITIIMFAPLVKGCNEPVRFYNSEGQLIPVEAVQTLVKAQYEVMSKQEADTLNKYFLNDTKITQK